MRLLIAVASDLNMEQRKVRAGVAGRLSIASSPIESASGLEHELTWALWLQGRLSLSARFI